MTGHPIKAWLPLRREAEGTGHSRLAGLFPEYVASLPQRGLRLDAFVDYVKAGKESYHVVSCFDQFEYLHEAPLFRRLSDSFELCVFGLNLVKVDLEQSQRAYYQRLRGTLHG